MQQILTDFKSQTYKNKDIQNIRDDMMNKLQTKNDDIKTLELEVQRLVGENDHLASQNEDLSQQIENMRAASLDHLENMESELLAKQSIANAGEQ